MEYLNTTGLVLDLVGFVLVIKFGHDLFLRTITQEEYDKNKHKDPGTLYLISDNGESIESNRNWRLFAARMGVGLVASGFTLQIFASVI